MARVMRSSSAGAKFSSWLYRGALVVSLMPDVLRFVGGVAPAVRARLNSATTPARVHNDHRQLE